MTWRGIGLAVVAAISAGAPACYQRSVAAGLPCSPSGECPAGQTDDREADPSLTSDKRYVLLSRGSSGAGDLWSARR